MRKFYGLNRGFVLADPFFWFSLVVVTSFMWWILQVTQNAAGPKLAQEIADPAPNPYDYLFAEPDVSRALPPASSFWQNETLPPYLQSQAQAMAGDEELDLADEAELISASAIPQPISASKKSPPSPKSSQPAQDRAVTKTNAVSKAPTLKTSQITARNVAKLPKHLQDALDEYQHFRPSRLRTIILQINAYFSQVDRKHFFLRKLRQDARAYLAFFENRKLESYEDLAALNAHQSRPVALAQTRALIALAEGKEEELAKENVRLEGDTAPLSVFLNQVSKTPSNDAYAIAESDFFPSEILRLKQLLTKAQLAALETESRDWLQKEWEPPLLNLYLLSLDGQFKWKQLIEEVPAYYQRSQQASLRLFLAKAHNRLEAYEDARVILSEMATMKHQLTADDLAVLAYEQGKSAFGQKDFGQAVIYFQEARERAPENYMVHMNLGSAFHESGQYAPAILAFQDAARLNPLARLPWKYMGVSFLELQRPDQAQRAFENARVLGDQTVETRYQLSLALKQQDKTEAARRLLDQIGTEEVIESQLQRRIVNLRLSVQ